MAVTLEVCVDCADGLSAAVNGGADRIELCAALPLGGLTPSVGLMALAARAPVPVMAMIRPRAGDFVWSEVEVGMMEEEIAAARKAGLAGVVLGASHPDGRLDDGALHRLCAAARGLDLTLHRCFDLVPDPLEALETAIGLGFRRVLTSGGALTAKAGSGRIATLIAKAGTRISVMPGAGVTPENVRHLRELGASEVHASCSVLMDAPERVAALGFAAEKERRTSAEAVRRLKAALG